MKKRIVAIVMVCLMSVGLIACGGDNGGSESENDKKEYLSESEIANLFSDPDNYKGKYVKLSGKIFNGPDTADDYVAYQAWHDVQNSTNDFVFGMESPEEDFNVDDYVVVDGRITGTFEGTNAFGTTIECPQIDAISIEKQSYMEAVVPTIKEITPENAVSEQNGISLKVDKIEFAEKETRIYLTDNNASSDKFSFSVYDIKITQNGQQISQDVSSMSSYEGEYPELSYEILPNATSSGVLVFPAIDSSAGFQIYAEGYSDNWELEFSPFTIDISVQ